MDAPFPRTTDRREDEIVTIGDSAEPHAEPTSRLDEDVDARLARFLDLPHDTGSSLVAEVTLKIARDIIEGTIPPGSTLDSITLADRFGISRTPIREALITLEHAGLVVIQPRRRPRAFDPSLQQVVEIYELRAELHALVARKVVRHATDEQIEALDGPLSRMQQAAAEGDVARFFWANVGFHDALMDLTADATLRRTIEGLGLQVLRLRRLGVSHPGRMERALADNERLLLAMKDRDENLAAELARSLILRALDGLRRVLGESSAG